MMAQSTRFWDRIAERYSTQPVADEATYQKKLQITREYFRPDTAVLEFGCGTGSTAIVHAPHVKHIQAIDLSSKMIEIAQARADADNVENVTFAQSTVDGIPAKARPFLSLPRSRNRASRSICMTFVLDTAEQITKEIDTIVEEVCSGSGRRPMYGGIVFELEPGIQKTLVWC